MPLHCLSIYQQDEDFASQVCQRLLRMTENWRISDFIALQNWSQVRCTHLETIIHV
ncbi:hypothetical protein FKM82_010570 [Ascaphus truei]